jgi:hypothetical protein
MPIPSTTLLSLALPFLIDDALPVEPRILHSLRNQVESADSSRATVYDTLLSQRKEARRQHELDSLRWNSRFQRFVRHDRLEMTARTIG